jgi:hypothetical protein
MLDNLELSVRKFEERATQAQIVLIEEIKGGAYFDLTMVESIRQELAKNAITPAVVSQTVATLANSRQEYLTTLGNVQSGLSGLGVTQEAADPGDVELGVLIPRDLFENELGNLSQELAVINRIIRIFSEITTGTVQAVELRQISTSDPIFSLGIHAATVLAIGKTVDWLTNKWREIEEIRKLRAETSKLEIEAALPPIDDKIQSIVDASILHQKNELMKQFAGDKGRRNELEIGLQWALESLIARIERGLTIEVRVLSPPADASETDGVDQTATYDEISAISRNLQFQPSLTDKPILKLPPGEPPAEAKSPKTRSKQ